MEIFIRPVNKLPEIATLQSHEINHQNEHKHIYTIYIYISRRSRLQMGSSKIVTCSGFWLDYCYFLLFVGSGYMFVVDLGRVGFCLFRCSFCRLCMLLCMLYISVVCFKYAMCLLIYTLDLTRAFCRQFMKPGETLCHKSRSTPRVETREKV